MGKISNKPVRSLNESERRFQYLAENLNGMVYRCKNDSAWTMEYVSAYAETLTGYSTYELIDSRVVAYADLINVNDRKKVWAEIQAALLLREAFVLTYRIRTVSGEEKWVWEQGRGVFDEEGELLALEGFVTDITESKHEHDELARTQELLEKTFASLSDALLVLDVSTRTVVTCNQAVQSVFGYSKAEIIGRNTLFLHLDKDHYENFYQSGWTLDGPSSVFRTEYQMRRKDGRIIDTDIAVSVIRDDSGARQYSVIALRDVTEKKQAEKQRMELQDQLNQSQKMEAVGRLAGGIAHDFNNLLAVILGYGDIMLNEMPPDNPFYQYVKDIREAGMRASRLTRQLLAFSRKQSLEFRVVDLNLLITDFKKLLRRVIGEDIVLELALSPDTVTVMADASQLEQVLMNLAVNARDAMPEGGRISIGTSLVEKGCVSPDHEQVDFPGPCVMLTFDDSGHGMDQQTLSRVFEPFFSTKSSEKGTGLGLATSFGIIRQHGGSISVESTPGEGTVFSICLPVCVGDITSPSRTDAKAVTPKGSGTVLIAEDEPTVLNLARKILVGNGYEVMASTDVEDALSLARDYGKPIHLLLTDVVMPGMKGPALYEQLLKTHPETRVLYMSGYTGEAFAESAEQITPRQFLQKPFEVKTLLDKVAGVLEGWGLSGLLCKWILA